MKVLNLCGMLSFSLTASSCFTTPDNGRHKNMTQQEDTLRKKGDKSRAPQSTATSATPEPGATQTKSLEQLFERISDPTRNFSQDDLQVALSLKSENPLSIEQAIIIAAHVRSLLVRVERSKNFHTSDLYDHTQPAHDDALSNEPKPSLEQVFRDLGVDLKFVLQQNPYLVKQITVHTLIQKALESTINSPSYAASMSDVFSRKPDSITTDSAQSPESVAASPSLDESKPESISNSKASIAEPSEDKLKRSDAVLMQAQKLADKGSFKQAIEQSMKISPDDPFFDLAREKIKNYSNQGVQTLRQKAAEAFQSSIPLNEPKAKQAYLLQSLKLLEEALENFPEADHIDRVKENLEVIKRDLALVKTELESTSSNK